MVSVRSLTLQQRLTVYLLLPVAMMLLAAGALGFLKARETILREWREAALLSLERATHEVDMKLGESLELIQAFQQSLEETGDPHIQSWILAQLRRQEWVKEVKWSRANGKGTSGRVQTPANIHPHDRDSLQEGGFRPLYEMEVDLEKGILKLESSVRASNGEPLGTVAVTMDLHGLLGDALRYGWRESEQACLVDQEGRFIAHAGTLMTSRGRLGENGDPLEMAILSHIKVDFSGTIWGPGMPPELIAGFHRLQKAPWTMILFAKGKDVLAPVLGFRDYYLLALAVAAAAILLTIRLVIGPRAKMIQELCEVAGEVARGNYVSMAEARGQDEISRLVKSFNEMIEGLKERDLLTNTFGRYVDHEIAKEILRKPEAMRLGGQKRTVAIMIADLRGFTPLAESLTPEKTIQILNRFFGTAIEIIRKHRGIIVDFFGDSVLSFFDPIEEPVRQAVLSGLRCAFEMQQAMAPLNEANRRAGLPVLQVGVGLHAGEVIVGNIGSESRAKYGIVGSAVNLTHRIQQLAGPGEVVVSDDLYREAEDWLRPKASSEVSLKGVQKPMRIHWVEEKRRSVP
jgi:class 3 adenylate cyclase